MRIACYTLISLIKEGYALGSRRRRRAPGDVVLVKGHEPTTAPTTAGRYPRAELPPLNSIGTTSNRRALPGSGGGRQKVGRAKSPQQGSQQRCFLYKMDFFRACLLIYR